MRNQNRHLGVALRLKVIEDRRLRRRIHGRGRLIEHQDVGVAAHERPRERDLLPLSARQLASTFEPATQLRFVALGHVLDERCGHAGFGGLRPTLGVVNVANIPGTNVFADRELVAAKVLKDDANALAQGFDVPVLQVQPVEEDVALGRLVEPGQQLYQCRLARAVFADQCQTFTRENLKADISQRLVGRAR